MKKSIFIAVLGTAFTAACYGQGKIQFSNYSVSSQTTGIFFGSGPLSGQFAGSEISAILLFGASTDTLISQLAPIGSPVAMATSLGYSAVSGGGAIGSGAGWFGNPTFTIDAANPGTTYAFAIEATGTFGGVTYTGFSPIVDGASQASSGVPIPNLPSALRNGSFSISGAPVPEPTTLALAGLGGLASLVMMRRKKA